MEAEHKRLIIAQCPRPFLTGQICCCWKTEIVCWGKQTHRKGLLLQSIILERLSLIFYCKRHFFVKFGIMIKEWIILNETFFPYDVSAGPHSHFFIENDMPVLPQIHLWHIKKSVWEWWRCVLLVCALPLCYRLITAELSQCCHNLEDWLFLFHAALKCYMIHSNISTAGVDKYTRFSCEANNTKGITTSREAHVNVKGKTGSFQV